MNGLDVVVSQHGVERRVVGKAVHAELGGLESPAVAPVFHPHPPPAASDLQFGGTVQCDDPAVDLYGLLSPRADRHLLARPEFKAMFLDDLLNGSRKQLAAPFADVIAFARDWGFRLDEVKVPVRWWHGDHDHIVPFSHGEHVVSRLPDAKLLHLPGESHLAGLGRGEEILSTLMQIWDRDLRK